MEILSKSRRELDAGPPECIPRMSLPGMMRGAGGSRKACAMASRALETSEGSGDQRRSVIAYWVGSLEQTSRKYQERREGVWSQFLKILVCCTRLCLWVRKAQSLF